MLPIGIGAYIAARTASQTLHLQQKARVEAAVSLLNDVEDDLNDLKQQQRRFEGRMDHQSGRIDNIMSAMDKRVAVLETLIKQRNLEDKINRLYKLELETNDIKPDEADE